MNPRTIIADANLFLAYDPKNTNTYQDIATMAYFLISGEYCDDRIDPARWEELQRKLDIKIKPEKYGDYILTRCPKGMVVGVWI